MFMFVLIFFCIHLTLCVWEVESGEDEHCVCNVNTAGIDECIVHVQTEGTAQWALHNIT